MAVIDGEITGLGLYATALPTGFSADLDDFDPAETFDLTQAQAGDTTVHAARVIEYPTAVTWSLNAELATSYFDDYYGRIYIDPNPLALGNLLSAESHDVYVWNAYATAQALNTVSITNGDGVTLTEPEAAPTTFAAREERTYTVTVDIDGPPTVDADILFAFAVAGMTLDVTGQRVILWRWMPQEEYTEKLAWKTEILQTREAEQRIALRSHPRRAMLHTFRARPHEHAEILTASEAWSYRIWGLPVWAEHTRVSAAAGATAVDFDTSYADYSGGLAVLWQSPDNAVAVQIDTVRADGLDLSAALDDDWTSAAIMPLMLARTLDGIQSTRSRAGMWAEVSAEFLATEPLDIDAATSYDTYRGYDVMADGNVMLSDMAETVRRPVITIDNGQGPVAVETGQDYTDYAGMLGHVARSRADRWAWLQWLMARRGRQTACWLPTWNRDIDVIADIGAADANIEIQTLHMALYADLPADIMIVLRDGTTYYRRISAATLMADSEVITIDSALGAAVTTDQVRLVCFLRLVRLDADAVEMAHKPPYRVHTSIPVMRVSE